MTGIYALVHMAVDLSCAFLVYTYVLGGEQWYLWLLLYNFCAFALQMPIGAAADRLDRNSCVAAVSYTHLDVYKRQGEGQELQVHHLHG